ncbi:mCG1025452, partial [Mus musculus]
MWRSPWGMWQPSGPCSSSWSRVWSCVAWWLCMWSPCSAPGRSGSHCLPARSPSC